MRFESLRKLGKMTPSSLLRPPGLPIAIDFGTAGLKVLQIEGGEPPTLVAAAFVATPPDLFNDHVRRFDFQLDALPKVIRQGGFKGNRVVCAIPSNQTFCKPMQFQKTDGVSLESIVKAAVSSQVGCDPDALVYRHVEVPTPAASAGRQEVICTAVPRVLIDRVLGATRSAKLELVGIHSESAALIRAFEYITRRNDDVHMVTLYLDVGQSSTKVTIAHGTRLVVSRCIEVGGARLDELIMEQTHCSFAEARTKRFALENLDVAPVRAGETRERGVDPQMAAMASAMRGVNAPREIATALRAASLEERRTGDTVPGLTADVRSGEEVPSMPEGVDLSEPLEILTDEIQMCLRYHESLFASRRVDRALFVGGESRHRGLCQHIAKKLRIPAQVADAIARLGKTGNEKVTGVDFKHAQPGWAVVSGLCLCPTDL